MDNVSGVSVDEIAGASEDLVTVVMVKLDSGITSEEEMGATSVLVGVDVEAPVGGTSVEDVVATLVAGTSGISESDPMQICIVSDSMDTCTGDTEVVLTGGMKMLSE